MAMPKNYTDADFPVGDCCAAENTYRELWREIEDDPNSPSIFVTEDGGIGITVNHTTIVKPIHEWHAIVCAGLFKGMG